MLNLPLRIVITSIVFSCMLSACSSLIPSNYLGPNSIQIAQKVNGRLVSPRLIPISIEMLQTPKGRALLEPAMKPKPYRVGAFDNLDIIVWGHPDLSTAPTLGISNNGVDDPLNSSFREAVGGSSNKTILVQTDGKIFFPYVGNLKVAGLTVGQIQTRITKRLTKYLRHPQVSVQVARFRNRNVYILGEVQNPGMHPVTDKPLSLMEAITKAGGINPNSADPSHIYLIRGSYQYPDVFWLNAQTPQSLMIAEEFPLQENDIVYVSAASLTGLNRFLQQILPSLTTFIIAKGLS